MRPTKKGTLLSGVLALLLLAGCVHTGPYVVRIDKGPRDGTLTVHYAELKHVYLLGPSVKYFVNQRKETVRVFPEEAKDAPETR